MKYLTLVFTLLSLIAAGVVGGCSSAQMKSPDVSENVRHSLDSAGLKDVSVSQDRDKGVVTLNGHVMTEGDKAQAESLARSFATGEVVANQIAVLPPGAESETKAINSDLVLAQNFYQEYPAIDDGKDEGGHYPPGYPIGPGALMQK